MSTKSSTEDARTCRWGNSLSGPCGNKPEYRVITLSKVPDKNGVLRNDGPSVTLACRKHMTHELEAFKESNAQLDEPVRPEEAEEDCLTRDYAIVVVPIDLAAEDAQAVTEGCRFIRLKRMSIDICQGIRCEAVGHGARPQMPQRL